MHAPQLSLAGLATGSRVNGPGRRIVVWVQGCDLACPGCFNPGTHDPRAADTDIGALADRILAAREGHDGVTFSGGEPFQQAAPLAALAERLRARWPDASLMAFTGYTLEGLRGPDGPPGASDLLSPLDWLVDGRYDPRRRARLGARIRPWRASGNQRLWVLGRPLPVEALVGAVDAGDEDTERPSMSAELHIEPDGSVLMSGFPDPALRRAIQALPVIN